MANSQEITTHDAANISQAQRGSFKGFSAAAFFVVFVELLVLVLVELELFDFPPLDLDELLFDDDDFYQMLVTFLVILLLFPFPDDDLLLLFELDFDELFAAKNSSNWNSSSSENNIFDSVECHDRITMKQAKANIVFVYIFCIKEFSN